MMMKKRHSLTLISYMNTKQFRSLWWQVAGGGGLLVYKCHLSVSNCRDFRSSWGPWIEN